MVKSSASTEKPHIKPHQKPINLALQGGGAHGAYAWGVLDALLEDGRLYVESICGCSAGAMNAVIFASGLHEDGAEAARKKLHEFWRRVAEAGGGLNPLGGPLQDQPWDAFLKTINPDYTAPAQIFFDAFTRSFAPKQWNPFGVNPLQKILDEMVDFKELRKCDKTQIFISATNVQTGKAKVFYTEDLNIECVLASACLPFLFDTVEVNGKPYWDGGFMGNPALYPAFERTKTSDMLIVHINPIERKEVPDTATEIVNRVNEISFNSSLLHELRAIAFVQKLLDQGMMKEEFRKKYKYMLMHAIRAENDLSEFSAASKFNADWDFLCTLRDRGRDAMHKWLKKNYEVVGTHATVDIRKEYLEN
ncbi:MAG: patatin-like phospholipase family protein [Alphaproteobacteria bacterium]|nr:patatin-like phospholipase family protein [Alphaproteobacteria bacterium]